METIYAAGGYEAVGIYSVENKKNPAPESVRRQSGPMALQEGDYYMDGPYMVFTAQYHLRRGRCCGSGCRHCPYGNAPKMKP